MPHGSPRIRFADGRMNVIGSRLKQWRVTQNITQDRLCGAVARITEGAWIPTRHDVYRIEVGTRTVSDAELIALAGGLGCSVVWLISGVESEPPALELAAQVFHHARPAGEMTNKPDE